MGTAEHQPRVGDKRSGQAPSPAAAESLTTIAMTDTHEACKRMRRLSITTICIPA